MPKKSNWNPRRKNSIAKDLRTPKYKMRVVKDKRHKKQPKQKTQREVRAALDPEHRCALRGCHFPKEPWMIFCSSHWYRLAVDLRRAVDDQSIALKEAILSGVKIGHNRRLLFERIRDAKRWLRIDCAPLTSTIRRNACRPVLLKR